MGSYSIHQYYIWFWFYFCKQMWFSLFLHFSDCMLLLYLGMRTRISLDCCFATIKFLQWYSLAMTRHRTCVKNRLKVAGSRSSTEKLSLFTWAQSPGPVVQSVVSLTISLRVISLTVLADSIYSILRFFAEKKLLTFFQQKISEYLRITWCKF